MPGRVTFDLTLLNCDNASHGNSRNREANLLASKSSKQSLTNFTLVDSSEISLLGLAKNYRNVAFLLQPSQDVVVVHSELEIFHGYEHTFGS